MFKIVMIDSDALFINSMINNINWSAYNFKVIKTYTNASKALSYLRNIYVDAVIINTQTPDICGLEFAQICHREMHPAKIILLSEAKDYDLIRNALRCGVFDVLEKPLNPAEFRSSMLRLTACLDDEKNKLKKSSAKDILSLKDEFFSDLLCGYIETPVDLNLRLHKAELDETILNRECALLNIHIHSFTRILQTVWDFGIENFYKTLISSFPEATDSLEFVFGKKYYNNIELLCINKSHLPIKKVVEGYMPEFSRVIMEVFNVYSKVRITKIFSSVSDILKNTLSSSTSTEIKSEKVIENAVNYIRHNYFRDITLEDVAKYVNLSREYFCSYYKKKTGETYTDTLNKLRIEHAKKLLSDTAMRVNQIAEIVGYRSPSYFHKTFKHICGISPSDYRKQETKLKN